MADRVRQPSSSSRLRRGGPAVAIGAFLLLLAPNLFAQQTTAAGLTLPADNGRPRVVIVPLSAPANDPPAEQIAATVTQSLALMLHLTGSFAVINADFLDPAVSYERSTRYFREVDARVALFGRVSSDLKAYAVYADGQLVARNRSTVRVLTGKRTIIVAIAGPLGDEPVETFHVAVTAGKTVSLSLNARAAAGETTGGAINRAPTAAPRQGGEATGGSSPTQAASTMGSLTVVSSPDGATVTLDGRLVGSTPLTLPRVAVGDHVAILNRRYFMSSVQRFTVSADQTSTIYARLTVNRNDPEVADRLVSPTSGATQSGIWTALQLADYFSPLLGKALGGSFPAVWSGWTDLPARADFVTLSAPIDDLFLRIGNRLVGNGLQTWIGDGIAGAGVLVLLADNLPLFFGNGTSTLSGGGIPSLLSLAAVAGTTIYDAISAYYTAPAANARVEQYLIEHGTLPPRATNSAHAIVLETGGNSLLRAGYRFSLVTNHLYAETTAGLGASSLSPFIPLASVDALLSYNPWGTKTGNARPEIHLGLRGELATPGIDLRVEVGTGTDWIGRSFDIFARGGFEVSIVKGTEGQFLTVGTRF